MLKQYNRRSRVKFLTNQKTALIKLNDHKKRFDNGIIEPVYSPLDYFCHVKPKTTFEESEPDTQCTVVNVDSNVTSCDESLKKGPIYGTFSEKD